MALSADFLDELKARLNIVEIVGRKVVLRRAGREHTGLCPFHNEKTPSFTVSEEKGFYHCFGCAAHGSAIDFVMNTEGLSFPEAVERLAAEAGMDMPQRTPQDQRVADERSRLRDVMAAATDWYQAQLASGAGRTARDYLATRGRTAQSVEDFRLGYAPAANAALKTAMLERGHKEADLLEAGLLAKSPERGDTYDRFRDRLMFPIADRRGQVIAFGGRALGEARAKYLNSPATPLFDKGRVLYNADRARKAAYDQGSILVAEGYMDVIALAEAGFAHAVAPLGTAVTESHLEMLWRMVPEPVMCLDGDTAGLRAAVRAAERALPVLKPGRSLRFAMLPEGNDPDDLLRQGGAQALHTVLGAALPLSEVLWRNLCAGRRLSTPEDRAALEADIGGLTAQIGDDRVRGHYSQHLRDRFWELVKKQRGQGGRSAFRRKTPGDKGRRGTQTPEMPRIRGNNLQVMLENNRSELQILKFVLAFPALIEPQVEVLAQLRFREPQLDSLWNAVLEVASRHPGLDFAGMRDHLSSSSHAAAFEAVAGIGGKKLALTREVGRETPAALLRQALERYFRDVDLSPELHNAELTLGDDTTGDNFAKLEGVLREKADAQEMDTAEPDRFGEEPKAGGAV